MKQLNERERGELLELNSYTEIMRGRYIHYYIQIELLMNEVIRVSTFEPNVDFYNKLKKDNIHLTYEKRFQFFEKALNKLVHDKDKNKQLLDDFRSIYDLRNILAHWQIGTQREDINRFKNSEKVIFINFEKGLNDTIELNYSEINKKIDLMNKCRVKLSSVFNK